MYNWYVAMNMEQPWLGRGTANHGRNITSLFILTTHICSSFIDKSWDITSSCIVHTHYYSSSIDVQIFVQTLILSSWELDAEC